MAMAIESLGVPAISFTGVKIGLVTDSFHTKERIKNISNDRMTQALANGKIVIVAGFQGMDENYNITTRGREAAPTTRPSPWPRWSALSAWPGTLTDVDGVYTTDPRIVPDAGKIDRISYDETLALSSSPASPASLARCTRGRSSSPRSTVSRSTSAARFPTHRGHGSSASKTVAAGWVWTGAELARDEARITILGLPHRPGVVHLLFQTIARSKIVVDIIVQNVATDRATEVSFTVALGRPG